MIGVVKLLSGEELLAEINDEGDVYRLNEPFLIGLGPNSTVAIVPFMMYSKASEEVRISKSAVICIAEAREEVVKQYQLTTGRIITMDRMIQKH